MTNMIRTNFHITELQARRLKALSEKSGMSVAELVRRAIDAYLATQERKGARK